MKQCTKCKEVKPETEFYKYARAKDGYAWSCKKCRYKYSSSEKGRRLNKAAVNRYLKKHPGSNNKWQRDNPEVAKKYHREYYKANKNKPSVKLGYVVRAAISYSLRKGRKTKKTFDMLDFTIDELKVHLEAQFQPGMSWANYGEWHIDHKVPMKAFNFDSPEQIDFKRCWALENLQPMWADENIKKAAKLREEFQPMLKLESA